MSLKPVMFYHGNCPDGFGAAFAFWLKYRDTIEYIPLHNNYLPYKGIPLFKFEGRDIWIVDVALEREEMLHVSKIAKSLILLDHHDSNRIKLENLPFCQFDLSHSGAILAWHHCFPGEPPPLLLQYIETRDIHKWDLPHAVAILAAVDSYEKTFENWEQLKNHLDTSSGFAKLLSEGEPILRYMETLMKTIKKTAHKIKISGYEVPVVNTPFFRNEILNEFALTEPFAAGYDFDGNDFIFSLRSSAKGMNVNVIEIAEKFGGGGHPNAAGFRVKSLSELNKES